MKNVPVPVYCRPLVEKDPNRKVRSSGVESPLLLKNVLLTSLECVIFTVQNDFGYFSRGISMFDVFFYSIWFLLVKSPVGKYDVTNFRAPISIQQYVNLNTVGCLETVMLKSHTVHYIPNMCSFVKHTSV